MTAKPGGMTRAAAVPAPEVTVVAQCHGIDVPASPHLGPTMIEAIKAGRYEGSEITCGLACIPKGARILELGAGAGIVGAVLARHLAPAAMMSVEANAALLGNIRALHAHNGVADQITLRHGVVLADPDAPDEVEFFIMGNFLGSGLTARNPDRARPVTVPVIRYDDLKRDFPHDAIMMDIEGGELEFLRHADLSHVKVLVGEFHREIYGSEGMKECRALLVAKGFHIDEVHSRPGVHVWHRA
jgi:FkbM family methyltransferase